MKKAFSAKETLRVKKRVINLEGEWRDAFGTPDATGVWFICGPSGSGKSSFAMQVCKELSRRYATAYNSIEEGISLSLQNSIIKHDMVSANRNFKVIPGESIEELEERIGKQRSPHVYIIDSFQYAKFTTKSYSEFIRKYRNKKLIIFISHADGKQPAGRPAKAAQYDADLKIWVEGYRAFSRGRFIGPKDYYTIWPEGAEKYWGSEIPTNKTDY